MPAMPARAAAVDMTVQCGRVSSIGPVQTMRRAKLCRDCNGTILPIAKSQDLRQSGTTANHSRAARLPQLDAYEDDFQSTPSFPSNCNRNLSMLALPFSSEITQLRLLYDLEDSS
jgi:hypothetical protein